jgi:Helix-turn-helix domain
MAAETKVMIKELQAKPPLRQTYLLENEEPRPAENGRPKSERRQKEAAYEQACCEELERIQARLDEMGVLLRELLQATSTKPTVKQSYSTHDVARILGKRPFTVREWCRLGRINARRALSGRGVDKEWRITHEELERIQNDGLLPVPKRY